MGELAEQMRIAHHSAVGMVDRMEGLGLLKRVSSEHDRRRVEVSVARKGHHILEKLYRIHRAELRSVGPQIGGVASKSGIHVPENILNALWTLSVKNTPMASAISSSSSRGGF
jgi:DNA-binding MarR family transcriptional regulator